MTGCARTSDGPADDVEDVDDEDPEAVHDLHEKIHELPPDAVAAAIASHHPD
jgi:hypothetical protein